MARSGQLVPALAVLVTITACNSRAPTAPGESQTTRPSGGPGFIPLPPVSAEISIRSISHEPGATLTLQDCGGASGHRSQFCTEELRMVFDVAADRDMPSVALRVTYLQKSQRCAFALTTSAALSAHVPSEMRTTLISYYLNPDDPFNPTDVGCHRPPATTTDMTVELIDYSEVPRGVSVVTKRFPHSYLFVIP